MKRYRVMWGFFEERSKADPSRPVYAWINEKLETNISGIYLVGDLTGFSLLKLSINQGSALVESMADDLSRTHQNDAYDLVIIGAGAAGLSAAMAAHENGMRYVVLESALPANTIRDFFKGKKLFAEPEEVPVKGKLWFEECSREELLSRWDADINAAGLNILTDRNVTDVRRLDGALRVETSGGEAFETTRVILAIGKQGNPRKLGVPGENLEKVKYRLYDAAKIRGQNIVVAGAGDNAVETALALCERNGVAMVVRGKEISRPKPANKKRLREMADASKLHFHYESTVSSITDKTIDIKTPGGILTVENDLVFVCAGAEPPWPFLRKIGIRTENEFTPRRKAFFITFVLLILCLYAFKESGKDRLIVLDGVRALLAASPVAAFVAKQWYGILYTSLVLGMGVFILTGPRRRHFRLHNYVRMRTISCMFFQTVFLFALPAVPARWLGGKAASLITVWPLTLMPAGFANKAFVLGSRSPEIVFYALFTAFLAFVAMPVFVYFNGKRYCSWICGCGALSETFGEPFRHLSPKGYLNRRRERIIYVVLAASVFMSGALVLKGAFIDKDVAGGIAFWYNLIVYAGLSGVIGVGMYPFFGPRIWCRYLCPLAAYMNLLGAVKTRFRISSNDRCIDCGACNRYCEMGIDVKGFALKQQPFSLRNTPCIGCGECIAVCPMHVLRFGDIVPDGK